MRKKADDEFKGPELKPLTSDQPAPKLKVKVKKDGIKLPVSDLDKKGSYGLGFATGYINAIMPPNEVFLKVAQSTNLPYNLVKRAYVEKKALGPLGAALGGTAGVLALPHIKKLVDEVFNLNGVGADEERTMDIANRNMEFSKQLQALRGSYSAAPNPWGN